jgi:Flp pilus assembly protein TadD
VAWVSERKDLLCGLFWMLSLLAYRRYARRPGRGRYALVALCFAAGLMAKPMAVTLPFALLLLDVWPLGRLRTGTDGGGESFSRLIVEKLPLLVLAAASGVITLLASAAGGAMHVAESTSFGLRLANAIVAYGAYLWTTVWPLGLACFYPHPAHTGGVQPLAVTGSALLLTAVTAVAVLSRRRRPWLAVGWLWFLGVLVPTLGLVQVGYQARADRYTYLPSIGLCVAAAWLLDEWVGGRRGRRAMAVGASVVLLVGWMVLTSGQLGHWQSTRALFEHALRVTDDNYVARYGMGIVHDEEGDLRRAEEELRSAVAIWPEFAAAHNRLGLVLQKAGRYEEARGRFERALELVPEFAEAHSNLGSLLERQGDLEGALDHLRTAVRLRPDFARAHNNLGIVYARRNDLIRARAHYERSVELMPDLVEAWSNLGNVFERRGRHREAVARYGTALGLDADHVPALAGLAWLLATSADPQVRDGTGALRRAERCADVTDGRDPGCLEALAAAHAELGQFERAVHWQTEALERTPEWRAAEPRLRLDRYRAGLPLRVPSSGP